MIRSTSPGHAAWSVGYGPFFSVTGGLLSVRADGDVVRVLWNGQDAISVPRQLGDPCCAAGFKLSKHNPSVQHSIPNSFVDVRLMDWRLHAKSRSVPVARKLVAVAGGQVWAESAEGALADAAEDADTLAAAPLVSAAACNGGLFILDGAAAWQYNPLPAADRVKAWTGRRGEVPSCCRIVANWRNRLVLAGDDQDPRNYFMSRQDDPWDFQYGMGDANGAVAGDRCDAGRLCDPIRALCPLGDDILVFGCSRSIWTMQGDPAHGGQVHRRSDQTGILCQNAWTTDTQGNMYFPGEQGLYIMSAAAGTPKHLSAVRAPQLAGLSAVEPGKAAAAGQCFVSLAFDAQRDGVLIYVTPQSGAAGAHWFYDIRCDALFPESAPAAIGPSVAAFHNASLPAARRLMLGGRNGWLYQYDDAAASDVVDGTTTAAIESHVWLGVGRHASAVTNEAVLTHLSATLGSDSDAVDFEVHGGAGVQQAMSGAAAAAGTWHAGHNTGRPRVRAAVHGLRIGNRAAGKAWGLETLSAKFQDGGLER